VRVGNRLDGDPLATLQGRAAWEGHVREIGCRQDSAYTVALAPGLFGGVGFAPGIDDLVSDRDALIVTTPTVACLYGESAMSLLRQRATNVEMLVLQCDEEHKTMDEVGLICRRALDVGLGRTGVLVALGGGVCSDLVTVAAAIIRRGIGHVRMPTTLVGQVDAGIGIKGATNHFGRKSFLGVFHPPRGVLIDSRVLASLPTPFVRDGIAEIIKVAVVLDAGLLRQLHIEGRTLLESGFQSECGDAVIGSAITAMLDELEPNIFESNTYRRLVDFGHTFSPALESACGFAISHGQAVAVDIALSSALAVELEFLPRDEFELIADVIASVGLPVYTPRLTLDLCRKALERAEEHRGGSANLVVPDGLGSGCFVANAGSVTDQALQHALARVRQLSTRLVPV